jgi:hypothetical protein
MEWISELLDQSAVHRVTSTRLKESDEKSADSSSLSLIQTIQSIHSIRELVAVASKVTPQDSSDPYAAG